MINVKEMTAKLKFVYEDNVGNMTFSNVNPNASKGRLMDLADGLNYLRPEPFVRLYKVEESELVSE